VEFYNLNTALGSSSVSLFHWLITLPRLAKKHQGMTFLHWHNLVSDNTIIPITPKAGKLQRHDHNFEMNSIISAWS